MSTDYRRTQATKITTENISFECHFEIHNGKKNLFELDEKTKNK